MRFAGSKANAEWVSRKMEGIRPRIRGGIGELRDYESRSSISPIPGERDWEWVTEGMNPMGVASEKNRVRRIAWEAARRRGEIYPSASDQDEIVGRVPMLGGYVDKSTYDDAASKVMSKIGGMQSLGDSLLGKVMKKK